MDINPVLAIATRGGISESLHRGAFAVSDAAGAIVLSAGDIDTPVFPRSAVKAFQCIPVIESGAAARFGFSDEEIALCCSSHNGEVEHVRVATSMLAKCGCGAHDYECGAHWPNDAEAARALVRAGVEPGPIHNCCSGKHAGMLAVARHLGVDPKGYVGVGHPVQRAVAKAIERYCGVDLGRAAVGVDGCSVPTWASPLKNLALGFARLSDADNQAGARILAAVRKHPEMVEGPRGFDTRVMQAVPRLFLKFGAEGVYCGTIAHAGLGFAMKCDDGAKRAVQVGIATVLLGLDVWTPEERAALEGFAVTTLRNWQKIEVGDVRGVTASSSASA
jgi:L-asparaginase II